jgi:hypothetical protein
MRKIGVVAALLIALIYSVPAAANCEECSQYWYWQSNSWCKYCAPSYCGYFRCQIMYTGASVDYCSGGFEAGANECFTPGQGCIYEPSEHASVRGA